MAHSYRNIAGRDSTHEAFDELAHGKSPWESRDRIEPLLILAHQKLEQADRTLINELKPIISDLLTFTDTIIPDARETVRKYADAKFEYLSYCDGIEHVLLEHA